MIESHDTEPSGRFRFEDHHETLERIAVDVTARHAPEVDATATFPSASIDALAAARLLGMVSAPEVGGLGGGIAGAAAVVRRLARECPSTAMVVTMHYCGTAVLEQHADEATRRQAASGRHLSTLAFSEAGSRSHFWAPTSTARRTKDAIELDARKSWVTSAHHASAYVWSSRPVEADGASTLWLVPATAPGLEAPERFQGLGLRGNDSTPVTAKGVRVPESARLGEDGQGFSIMMQTVLPIFDVLISACSVGIMEATTSRAAAHASGQRYEHMEAALADLPTIRAYLARMRVKTDQAATLLEDTIAALTHGREDTMLRVLESKAAAGELSLEVVALGMRVCGGAAYRKDLGIERFFRDAQAANVMAPTTDALYDFIGKAICGMPLF
ncbi:MAG: acyl-CoA dehydrogenase family protein [Candidatus Eisenbacteria bacterium]|nr:acyl-CoA dehydrogenase family protein [Candidatus Eisenbacteria bacterium]